MNQIKAQNVFELSRAGNDGKCLRTDEHFIQKDTHAPPVAFPSIEAIRALGAQHLGRYIIGSTDSGVRTH